jgi:hypothetical protein
MTKWIKCSDRLPSGDGLCYEIFLVMHEKFYPEFREHKLIPELACYDYYIPFDGLAWQSLKTREWLHVKYYMSLPEPPRDVDE